ncbi:MAG: single-stranded DNA-binding protein, partial [Roseovarius sp.]|nr:single-stranded DNA-binding protein [Roseovarius sp.]
MSGRSATTPCAYPTVGGRMNSVQLIGRLTHDPEPHTTPNGTPLTTFRLAVDHP